MVVPRCTWAGREPADCKRTGPANGGRPRWLRQGITIMAATTECWLLKHDGTTLSQCQPGETIGGEKSKHLPGLESSLTLDRMGDLWFASLTMDGGVSALINGETVDPV